MADEWAAMDEQPTHLGMVDEWVVRGEQPTHLPPPLIRKYFHLSYPLKRCILHVALYIKTHIRGLERVHTYIYIFSEH
jgi:hypothetical protein